MCTIFLLSRPLCKQLGHNDLRRPQEPVLIKISLLKFPQHHVRLHGLGFLHGKCFMDIRVKGLANGLYGFNPEFFKDRNQAISCKLNTFK